MINRRTFLALAASVIATPALSEPRRLTAAEIDALLSGQKITGTWNGTPYTQSFSENGQTIYVSNSRPEVGRWRVNPQTDSYESHWERSGWSSYGIECEGGALYWVDSRGRRNPFEVAPE